VGDERFIDPLIEALLKYDDKDLAEVYLNCGNSQLVKVAQAWASEYGYTILYRQGGNPLWGSSSE
jgi:hypothetical protein